MASKLFILCAFAFVLMGITLAFDYEGESEGDDGGSSDGGAEGGGDGNVEESYGTYPTSGGGDYEGDSGEGGDYAAASGDESDDGAAASTHNAQYIHPVLKRNKRSLNSDDSKRVLRRVRRGGHGVVGPVYTYQKTDHHGKFKWGNH